MSLIIKELNLQTKSRYDNKKWIRDLNKKLNFSNKYINTKNIINDLLLILH